MKPINKLLLLATIATLIPTFLSAQTQEELPVYLDRGQTSDYVPDAGIGFRGLRWSVYYKLVLEPRTGEAQAKADSGIFLGTAISGKTKIKIYRDIYYSDIESAAKDIGDAYHAAQQLPPITTVHPSTVLAQKTSTEGAKFARIHPQESTEIASFDLDNGADHITFTDEYSGHKYHIEINTLNEPHSHYSLRLSVRSVE